ncbi:MAG: OmpA family protein [Candidatus Eremiobacteraeota bacterium]|nr:OmpA family protein [Candidatus Eremiobacteraeota bacterium]
MATRRTLAAYRGVHAAAVSAARRAGVVIAAASVIAVGGLATHTWAAPATRAAIRTIPLRAGLTLVEAGAGKTADYEALYHIDAVNPDGIAISLTTGPREFTVHRFVRRVDLEYAHRCLCSWTPGQPRVFAGSTAIGTSAAVIQDLRTRGSTLFVDMWQQPDAIPPYRLRTKQAAGTLLRLSSESQTMQMIVNDRLVQLPVMHAAGNFGDVKASFFWLDDPANPLLVHGDVGGGGGRLVKIYTPGRDSVAELEWQLQRGTTATRYDIYFEPEQSSLLVESFAALAAIAQVLRRNPSWRLRIAVYTDNLGGWDANLRLARKRAIALAMTLTGRYGIASKRVQIMGAGAADPVSGNLTVAGRAFNRRVVLSRF